MVRDEGHRELQPQCPLVRASARENRSQLLRSFALKRKQTL